jgi:type IV pilus assembly protein PilF
MGAKALRSLGRAAACCVLALGLAACVTTTIEGNKPKPDKKQEIERRVDAANQYLEKGNTEQAIVHLKRALELDPDDAQIHMTLAQVFWRTGEYELCDEHFRRAIALDPKLSRARNNYAAFLYERGDTDEAIRQLEAVVADTLYEKRAVAFRNLAIAYLKKGRRQEAEEALERAVKMDSREAPALLELADINYARRDFARANAYYARMRAVSQRQSPRSLLLGIRLAREARDRDAEASYALQLKGLYPNSAEYREYQATLAGGS